MLSDSTGNIKDSILCDYDVGRLKMLRSDSARLFKLRHRPKIIIYFNVVKRDLKAGRDVSYKVYLAPFEINEEFIILRLYDADVEENNEKYYFKKGQNYIYQVLTPGFFRIMPVRGKREK